MNALVASVIRTYVPVIVGQVASWLLLAHIVLPAPALVGLTAFVGGLLTAIYYGGVRILEQQWPSFGILLGLTASPDTYSKNTASDGYTATYAKSADPVVTVLSTPATPDLLATVPSIPATTASGSDGGFQSKVEAAISGPVTSAAPAVIEPDYSAPASVAPVAPVEVPATPAQ